MVVVNSTSSLLLITGKDQVTGSREIIDHVLKIMM
ncbi:hypothetical protein BVRB_6g136730 [Beta vulgaris subsp. vulgaris]|nr:hypothetical protein BVRB_6g136730 [Beta vulgaris subsp. vulgaris]